MRLASSLLSAAVTLPISANPAALVYIQEQGYLFFPFLSYLHFSLMLSVNVVRSTVKHGLRKPRVDESPTMEQKG